MNLTIPSLFRPAAIAVRYASNAGGMRVGSSGWDWAANKGAGAGGKEYGPATARQAGCQKGGQYQVSRYPFLQMLLTYLFFIGRIKPVFLYR
jgi:hypothetical protein